MKRLGLWLCLLPSTFAAGCVGSEGDPCARAAAHLAACGLSLPSGASCEAEAAESLAQVGCEQLAQAAQADKADGWLSLSGVACAAGLVRFCPDPGCSAPQYPSVSTTCADYIDVAGCGGCQYYACREAQAAHGCGEDGYYLGYALKYCSRFLTTLRPRLSPAGQRFLDEGRDCLMRFMESELPYDLACSDVKREALASHVACYHDHGFCQLPLADKYLLLNTVDPAQLDLVEGLRTALSCL